MIGGRLLTFREVADQLGCSVSTVRRRICAGELLEFCDGGLHRVREDDLRRYVAERVCRRSPTAEHALAPGRALPKGARLWDDVDSCRSKADDRSTLTRACVNDASPAASFGEEVRQPGRQEEANPR